MASDRSTYLGFDLSTQQLKGIVVTSDLKLLHEAKVDFDADLSHYGIHKGVLVNADEGEVFAPPEMWLEALDLVLKRLKDQGCDFSRVAAVSGAGMQHGTVFWSQQAEALLAKLDPAKGLHQQLHYSEDAADSAFAHPYSPNWQDASTQKQCEQFDAALGSPEALAQLTGSKAHHRFSGPQIYRYRMKYPGRYAKTARISLVSSFFASIFLGKIAPIDISDVTGMDLWDIPGRCWADSLLALAAGSSDQSAVLHQKLGTVEQDGGRSFGNVCQYFQHKYGFNAQVDVIPFTGDNPATILALPLRPADAMLSLGTSTTFLMSTAEYQPDPEYHFMNHPTTQGLYMFMLCYKNGGLAREHVRDQFSGSWDVFNEHALQTKPLAAAEDGTMRLGLYFPRPEIVPHARAGQWRASYNKSGQLQMLLADNNTADARNIVESQLLSIRLRAKNLVKDSKDVNGKPLPAQPRRIYLVGGGSANPAIAKLCGGVLGSAEGVYKLDIGGNACALGAAYKAVWGHERSPGESFESFIGARWDESSFVKKVADGYKEGLFELYGEALPGLQALEAVAMSDSGQ